jgi:hypothetical protein
MASGTDGPAKPSLKALGMADGMRGRDDHHAPGLPLDQLVAIMKKYRP